MIMAEEPVEQTGPNPAVVIGEIKAGLRAKGIEIADDADEMAVLIAIRDFLAGETNDAEGEGDGAGATEEAAAAASDLAGLLKQIGAKDAKEGMTLVLKAQGGAGAAEQLAAMSERLKALEAEKVTDTAESAVALAESEGKLAASQREWAMTTAKENPESFASWAKSAPVLFSNTPSAAPTGSNAGTSSRESLIAASIREFDTPGMPGVTTKENFINDALREAKKALLTDEEKKTHDLVAV